MGMHVPVEIGEAAKQRAIFEGRDIGKFGQADEGQPHADETLTAHRLQRISFDRATEDRGAAQARGVGA